MESSMPKPFSGITTVKGKTVLVSYNPGWGEIGEWYILYPNGHRVTVDDMEGFAKDQYDCLLKFSDDTFREKLLRCNWETVGTNDDVVKRALESVGYDEDSRMEDEDRIQQIQQEINEVVADLTTYVNSIDFDVSGTKKKMMLLDQALQFNAEEIETINNRMRVFDLMEEDVEVGLNWSNKTFLRDFGDTDLARRFKNILQNEAGDTNV